MTYATLKIQYPVLSTAQSTLHFYLGYSNDCGGVQILKVLFCKQLSFIISKHLKYLSATVYVVYKQKMKRSTKKYIVTLNGIYLSNTVTTEMIHYVKKGWHENKYETQYYWMIAICYHTIIEKSYQENERQHPGALIDLLLDHVLEVVELCDGGCDELDGVGREWAVEQVLLVDVEQRITHL